MRELDLARQIAQAANSVILSTYLASLSTPPSDYPPEKEVLALFEASKGKINAPARYRLSQIFVGRPANAGDVSTAKLRAEQFKDGKFPASALITVSHFARPGMLIEIQAVAAV